MIPLYVLLALLLYVVLYALVVKCSKHGRETPWIYAAFRGVFTLLALPLYRLRAVDANAVPEKGGVLLYANHAAYVDVILLGLACRRPIRFLSWDGFEKMPALHWFMRVMHTIPVSPTNARSAVRAAREALDAGGVVCIFPEGGMTRNGSLQVSSGVTDTVQFLEPELGVFLFVVCGFQKQFSDLFVAFFLGAACKVGVLVASLGFASEGGLKVLFGLCSGIFICHRFLSWLKCLEKNIVIFKTVLGKNKSNRSLFSAK